MGRNMLTVVKTLLSNFTLHGAVIVKLWLLNGRNWARSLKMMTVLLLVILMPMLMMCQWVMKLKVFLLLCGFQPAVNQRNTVEVGRLLIWLSLLMRIKPRKMMRKRRKKTSYKSKTHNYLAKIKHKYRNSLLNLVQYFKENSKNNNILIFQNSSFLNNF